MGFANLQGTRLTHGACLAWLYDCVPEYQQNRSIAEDSLAQQEALILYNQQEKMNSEG